MNNPNLSLNFNVFESNAEVQELQKLQTYLNNINSLVAKSSESISNLPPSICLGISTLSPSPLNTSLPRIIYETVKFDTQGVYDPATGKIKIKTAGKYRFSGSYESDGAGVLVATNNASGLIIAVGGVQGDALAFQRVNAGGVLILSAAGSLTLDLKPNQEVTILGSSDNPTTLATSSVYMEYVGA